MEALNCLINRVVEGNYLSVGIMAHYWNGGYTIEKVAHYWNGGYTIGMVAILLEWWL